MDSVLPKTSRFELFQSQSHFNSSTISKSFKAYDGDHQFVAVLSNASYQTSFSSYTETIVVHLTLRLPHSFSYEIGDVLCIYPPNPEWMVNELLQRLRISGDEVVRISSKISSLMAMRGWHIPSKWLTIYDIFRFCLDIRSIPSSKTFLPALSDFCEAQSEAVTLRSLSRRGIGVSTLIGLLNKFPSCYPSLELLL